MILKLILEVLNPEFLKNKDREFLLNHPRLWILKIYYLCYYAGLVNLLLLFLTCIYQFKVYHTTNIILIARILLWLEVIAIGCWSAQQFFYNIAYSSEKQFGNIDSRKDWLLDILGYTICLIIIASPVMISPLLMRFKILNNAFPKTDALSELVVLKSITFAPKLSFFKGEDENYFTYNQRFLGSEELEKLVHNLQINNGFAVSPLSKFDPINSEYKGLYNFLKENTSFDCNKNLIDCRVLVFLKFSNVFPKPSNVTSELESLCNMDVQLVRGVFNNTRELVQSLLSQNYELWYKLISKYSRVEKISYPSQASNLLLNALNNCQNYHHIVYRTSFFEMFLNYLLGLCFFSSIAFILFLHKYINTFNFALSFPYSLLIVCILGFSIASNEKFFEAIDVIKETQSYPWYYYFSAFIVSLSFFIILIFTFNNKRKRSKTQFLNLVASSFAILVSFIVSIIFIDTSNVIEIDVRDNCIIVEEGSIVLTAYDATTEILALYLIASLTYLPFIPFLKRELIKQLSLPKEK